jgi:hypothetical protein
MNIAFRNLKQAERENEERKVREQTQKRALTFLDDSIKRCAGLGRIPVGTDRECLRGWLQRVDPGNLKSASRMDYYEILKNDLVAKITVGVGEAQLLETLAKDADMQQLFSISAKIAFFEWKPDWKAYSASLQLLSA